MPDLLATIRGVLSDLHPDRLFGERIRIDQECIEADDVRVRIGGIGGIAVLGLGKAAVAQVTTVHRMLTEALGEDAVDGRGFAVTKVGHGEANDRCDVLEAAHPVPDATSRAAASELIWRARSTPPNHLLVFCLSGGGSALAVAPRAPFRLAEKLQANAELLSVGASIDETNLIRREMSAFKNGGLLAASSARRVLTLVSSDVPVPDLGVVASGPTVHQKLDPERVREVAQARLSRVLMRRIEAQLFGHQRRSWNAHLAAAAAEHASYVACVGDYRTLMRVTERRLTAAGFAHVLVPAEPFDMPMEEGVPAHVRALEELAGREGTWALATGGELPVKVRGDGRGGRNTEFVLRMARALWIERAGAIPDDVRDGLAVVAVGTDGSDGPTGAAGGWLTKANFDEARGRGLSIDKALRNSDSLTFLDRLDCAIRTGPTHTNLMDLRLIACPDKSTRSNC